MWGYLAFEDYQEELLKELQFHKIKETARFGRLFLLDRKLDLIWAQLRLENIQKLNFKSIKEATSELKNKNLYWGCDAFQNHRRNQLIRESLKVRDLKPYNFIQKLPSRDYGFWYLYDESTLFYSDKTGYPYPITEIKITEDKAPPSRAYMKLWELFTLHLEPPKPHEAVIDLGACPGGWTWVLLKLNCQVLSIDKAELDKEIRGHQFLKKDAFKLRPDEIKDPQWLFSDIICEPSKLLELVERWLDHHPNIKMVCTIKYKGKTDFHTTEKFKKIPGSRLIHLNCNKHEVTWLFPGVDSELSLRYP
ncbi:MAG: SAM-dependent methyltransferase [Bdellovibrionales bacterium]